MYAKYINQKFVRAPYGISKVKALALGFKPVVLTPPPETDEYHMPKEWLEETDTEIVRHWNIMEIPPENNLEDIDDSEILSILMGGT